MILKEAINPKGEGGEKRRDEMRGGERGEEGEERVRQDRRTEKGKIKMEGKRSEE